VLELLHAFERACGHELPHEIVDRRAGDDAASYADPSRAHTELGWYATRTVDDMCTDTWRGRARTRTVTRTSATPVGSRTTSSVRSMVPDLAAWPSIRAVSAAKEAR
jgi:hypothetical protein